MSAADSLETIKLIREIGRGAMSTVWEAKNRRTQTVVAVKMYRFPPGMTAAERAQMSQRCEREAVATSRIDHPNVVRVYGAGQTEEWFYLVMEFVRGVSVRDRLRMEGRFSPGSTMQIARQLCDALAAAHGLEIIHCDLKPENILLETAGPLQERTKLVDFGVSQAARGSRGRLAAWGGSPAYMSPEQVEGRRLDGRSDIFSLGVVLFEMLTGRRAFGGDSIVSVVHRIVNEPLEVDRLSRPLGEIVGKATQKRPLLRFATIVEMKEALEKAASDSG